MDSPPPPQPPEGPNLENGDASATPPSPPPPIPPQPGSSPGWPETVASADERNMALFCHLGSLAGYVLPLGNILLPLILWMVNKDKMPFVNDQGKESVNFQISVTIYVIASIVAGFVTCGAGFLITIGVGIFSLVMTIIASIDASKGIAYRYPLCIRMVE